MSQNSLHDLGLLSVISVVPHHLSDPSKQTITQADYDAVIAVKDMLLPFRKGKRQIPLAAIAVNDSG